jgi:hypothetical protein
MGRYQVKVIDFGCSICKHKVSREGFNCKTASVCERQTSQFTFTSVARPLKIRGICLKVGDPYMVRVKLSAQKRFIKIMELNAIIIQIQFRQTDLPTIVSHFRPQRVLG